MQERQLKDALAKTLQAPVRDELWDYLERKEFIQEVQTGFRDVNWLADETRAVMRAGAGEPWVHQRRRWPVGGCRRGITKSLSYARGRFHA